MVPANTPDQIVERLQREFAIALNKPHVQEKLAAQSAAPIASTTEEYIAFLEKESALWGDIIKSAEVKLE